MYEFTRSIEEVIAECKESGRGRLVKRDNNGNINLLLRAEWVNHYDGIHDVIELYIFYPNGKLAYSRCIEETKVLR